LRYSTRKQEDNIYTDCSQWIEAQPVRFNYVEYMDKVSCKNLPGKRKMIYLRKRGNQLSITVNLQVKGKDELIPAKVLIDSGCTGCAIGRKFIRRHELETTWLKRSI